MKDQISRPDLKIGLLTDTHITPDPQSLKLVRTAFELFEAQQVEIVIHCGDIADRHYPAAYRQYRQIFQEVFAHHPPQELYVYSHHDIMGKGVNKTSYPAVQKALNIPNLPYDFRDIKGWPLIFLPQHADWEKYQSMVAHYAAQYPEKPLLIFDHIPAYDTIYDSKLWGEVHSREILNHFPQAVQISGHSHNTLHNELEIWQGEFSVVNIGTLQLWEGQLIGTAPESKPNDGVVILEVRPDNLKFRRFDLKSQQEYQPDCPWTIPLPFVPETAPYRRENRLKHAVPPQFPAASTLTWHYTDNGDVALEYPEAENPEGIFTYKQEILHRAPSGQWVTWARHDIFGNFNQSPQARTTQRHSVLSGGYFEPGETYRIEVTPYNFFEQNGTPLTGEFTYDWATQTPEITFETFEPLPDCGFEAPLGNCSERSCDEAGFFAHSGYGRLNLPETAWRGPAGDKFRFTVDLSTRQSAEQPWSFMLYSQHNFDLALPRMQTPAGDTPLMRYILEITKHEADSCYNFVVADGAPGKIKISHVKIEKIS